jgi:hypothetical protein
LPNGPPPWQVTRCSQLLLQRELAPLFSSNVARCQRASGAPWIARFPTPPATWRGGVRDCHLAARHRARPFPPFSQDDISLHAAIRPLQRNGRDVSAFDSLPWAKVPCCVAWFAHTYLCFPTVCFFPWTYSRCSCLALLPQAPVISDRVAGASGCGSRRLTERADRRPRASAVRRAGGFRSRSEGEASGELGSGCEGAATGGFLGENRCHRSFVWLTSARDSQPRP